ncbi:ABC transporter permease [Cupriavidus campinensis]|uniref:ABC transporter permease n=1 Tax=Cupriavidus campinensis TaxID=151783 RepID=UPI001656845E|nr:ABC transporter permease [Cupriavidus campinensis]
MPSGTGGRRTAKFGILRLAYKLLVNDRAKFSGLLVGITFAVFLMIEMTSLFAGVLNRSSSTVYNIGASIWVMDPAVNTVANTIGMPDYVLDAVRSIDGVRFAVPLYSGGALVRLGSGTYQPVTVVGIDDTSLFGRPNVLRGKIEDIFAENAFLVVKDAEFRKLESPDIGTVFEINDHRGVIVGIAEVATSGLFGVPTLYTTYQRAIQYLPTARYTISYILVEPKSPADTVRIQRAVSRIGYRALTRDEFIRRISNFYKFQTGLGTNILLMTVISFIVGLSISGQTFYTFIIENLEKFGALKAIGAKGHELVAMIVFQATFVALTGYGLGIGLCAILIALARLRLPDYAAMITFSNLGMALAMVIAIAGLSGYIGVRKVLRIEPFDIFRG